jgi:DNA ligase D-like protein (predicted polymerase)
MSESRVRLSSGERVLFPDDGITKGDLFAYYGEVAPAILPHLEDRPFTMKRWREGLAGGSFFQKQAPKGMPAWIPTRQFRTWPREGESRLVDFPLVSSRDALLWMVQMHCIDMNTWYSRVDKPDRPDYVVFDLDPPEEKEGFPQAVRVAHLVRGALDALDLRSYVKTSGADGIHVRVRGAALAAARARAPGRGDDRVAEEEARRRARRPPPERPREDDRVGLLRAAEAWRAGVDAARMGGADRGREAARLPDGGGAGTGRPAGRPVRACAPGRAGACAGAAFASPFDRRRGVKAAVSRSIRTAFGRPSVVWP